MQLKLSFSHKQAMQSPPISCARCKRWADGLLTATGTGSSDDSKRERERGSAAAGAPRIAMHSVDSVPQFTGLPATRQYSCLCPPSHASHTLFFSLMHGIWLPLLCLSCCVVVVCQQLLLQSLRLLLSSCLRDPVLSECVHKFIQFFDLFPYFLPAPDRPALCFT